MTLKNLLLGFLIVILLFVGYAVHAGIALVHVNTPDTRLWIPVPVALGHLAGKFIKVPLAKEPELEKLLQYREAAGEIFRQLQDLPDSDFVEVSKRNEHVRVFKRDNSLYIQVDNPREYVRVRVPLRTLERLIEVLDDPQLDVGDLFACLEWQPVGDLVHVKTAREEVRVSIW